MSNWDDEIDDVARRMTGRAGSADMTGRVLVRIDRQTLPGRERRSAWVWSPVMVAAVLAFAVLLIPAPRNWVRNLVRLKPDTTDVGSSARLQPDTKDAAASIRLRPDTTGPGGIVRRAVVASG